MAIVRLRTAAFAASYAQTPDRGTKEDIEARLMMQPRAFRSIQRAATTCVGTTRPAVRLRRSTSSNSATSISRNGALPLFPPAQLMRAFTAPNFCSVESSAARTEPRSAASTSKARSRSAGFPASVSRATAVSALSLRCAQRLTEPPALISASAIAPAMTPPPPVMAMVFPASPNNSST